MTRLQKTDIISDLAKLLRENNDLFNPEDFITTEQFVTMTIRSYRGNIEQTNYNWSSGYMDYALQKGIIEDYDMIKIRNAIERRSVARIVHEILLVEIKEKDEDDWSAAGTLNDLYSCRTCVMHIAQVYVKGIMQGSDSNLFDLKGSITGVEAAVVVSRMLDKKQRTPKTDGIKTKIINLSLDEARNLMLNDNMIRLVDVRTNEEYKNGHMEGSVCIPLINIYKNPFLVCENRNTPIILYCQKGYKSNIAAQLLLDAGYSKVYNIKVK